MVHAFVSMCVECFKGVPLHIEASLRLGTEMTAKYVKQANDCKICETNCYMWNREA